MTVSDSQANRDRPAVDNAFGEPLTKFIGQPDQWLLHASDLTDEVRTAGARGRAGASAFVALMPAFAVGALFQAMFNSRTAGLIAWSTVMIGSAARGYVKETNAPDSVWESTVWVDFADRTWNRRVLYTEGSRQDDVTTIALDSLAIVCFSRLFERGPVYESALCELSQLADVHTDSQPRTLSNLGGFDVEQDSVDYALASARRCGIACWEYEWQPRESREPRLKILLSLPAWPKSVITSPPDQAPACPDINQTPAP